MLFCRACGPRLVIVRPNVLLISHICSQILFLSEDAAVRVVSSSVAFREGSELHYLLWISVHLIMRYTARQIRTLSVTGIIYD